MSGKTTQIIATVALLFLTLYIPLSLLIYHESTYHLNYAINGEPKQLHKATVTFAIADLITYFTYTDPLDTRFWSEKERRHYADVRMIYTALTIIAICSVFLVGLSQGNILWRWIAITDAALIGTGLLILSQFSWFWHQVFHPLLFSDQSWLMSPDDASYWLFPEPFFLTAIGFIVGGSFLLQLLIYGILRRNTFNREEDHKSQQRHP